MKSKEILSHFIPLLIFTILAAGSTDTDSSTSRDSPPSKNEDTSWVPAGFNRYNSNVAWRWSPDGSYKCDYGQRCVQVQVVSQKGCNRLYVEASKLDANGNNVGMTNDSTTNLQQGQKALLMLDTYGDFKSFQLAKISCY